MARVHCMPDKWGYKHTLKILIASPRQQWLHERAWKLRYSKLPFKSADLRLNNGGKKYSMSQETNSTVQTTNNIYAKRAQICKEVACENICSFPTRKADWFIQMFGHFFEVTLYCREADEPSLTIGTCSVRANRICISSGLQQANLTSCRSLALIHLRILWNSR